MTLCDLGTGEPDVNQVRVQTLGQILTENENV